MASEYGGSDRYEATEETAAFLEYIKVLEGNLHAEAAREERDTLIAKTSGGSGNGGSASEKEAPARS